MSSTSIENILTLINYMKNSAYFRKKQKKITTIAIFLVFATPFGSTKSFELTSSVLLILP